MLLFIYFIFNFNDVFSTSVELLCLRTSRIFDISFVFIAIIQLSRTHLSTPNSSVLLYSLWFLELSCYLIKQIFRLFFYRIYTYVLYNLRLLSYFSLLLLDIQPHQYSEKWRNWFSFKIRLYISIHSWTVNLLSYYKYYFYYMEESLITPPK